MIDDSRRGVDLIDEPNPFDEFSDDLR